MSHKHRLSINAASIELHDASQGKRLWSCKWDDVKEIVAWKDDAYTYDLICMGLRGTGQADYFRVDEEAEGWQALLSALQERYSIRTNDWWDAVAFPAFRENWTVLWGERLMRSDVP